MKIVVISVLLMEIALINGAAIQKEEFSCVVDVPYKLNECQDCICAGWMGCTRSTCFNTMQYKRCKVGTVWWKECNKCWCVEELGTVCTAYDCPPVAVMV